MGWGNPPRKSRRTYRPALSNSGFSLINHGRKIMRLLDKKFFLTTEFDETPESQFLLHIAIDALNDDNIPFELKETNTLKIGFWWVHRRYSVLGDLFLIASFLFLTFVALL